MARYIYDGPVLVFDKCVADHWKGETIAPSESKARSNLLYQFKKQNGKEPRTKVTLTGKIKKIG